MAAARHSQHVSEMDAPDCGSALMPLVVDLDRTLIRTDSLYETFLDTLRTAPAAALVGLFKLAMGRQVAKAHFAAHSPLDVEHWPARGELLTYLEDEAAKGRLIVLATAADMRVAAAIAQRFPFIGEVIASSPEAGNLKGARKARVLVERFPEGFIYAGDSSADLHVWKHSTGAIPVGASPAVARAAARLCPTVAAFPDARQPFNLLRRTLRLHQWVKNSLLLVPMLLAGQALNLDLWPVMLLGFLAIGLVASGTYIVNDLLDLPHDRRHATKRTRPLANGTLSIATGAGLAFLCLAGGLGLGWLCGPAALAMIGLYLALTLGYSLWLKRVPVLDVLTLAGLFTVRLGYGIVLANVVASPWLLVFSMFIFLSLSIAKRYTELLRGLQRGLSSLSGRGYRVEDLPLVLAMGMSAMFGAVLILVLYLIEDAMPRAFYANPGLLWAAPPAVFLFLGRVWLMAQRGQLNDDPVTFALRDNPSRLLGIAIAAIFAAALIPFAALPGFLHLQ